MLKLIHYDINLIISLYNIMYILESFQIELHYFFFQVERKRHIGNDIVNIIFIDGGPTFMNQFNPTFIKSQFTRILSIFSTTINC